MGHRRLTAALLAAALAASCTGGGDDGATPSSTSSTATTTPPARGGTVRVGVWGDPDPGAPTHAGAAVRALVLPQLFVAQPDGSWEASLVEPGSPREADDLRSVTFSLRGSARWSDGRPVSVEDLRRSADPRFVEAVEGQGRRVTLRFNQRLPGWRRLWSSLDSVPAPGDGVWGGPFVVAGRTPGLETVLRPNPRWWGDGPYLDEVRLVLVPDADIARRLFERGELDVLMPPAATVRTRELEAVRGARVDRAAEGGWWLGLRMRPNRLDLEERAALAGSIDRDEFVGTLLKREAAVLDTVDPGAEPGRGPWDGAGPGDPGPLAGDTVDLVATEEEPMTGLLERAMQKRTRPVDAGLELRTAEAHVVEPWVAAGDYDAAVVPVFDPPDPCWTCRWGDVAGEGATRPADAGEPGAVAALQRHLRDQWLVLPLWRPVTVVAWRGKVRGVEANGYALSAAWNAATWSTG